MLRLSLPSFCCIWGSPRPSLSFPARGCSSFILPPSLYPRSSRSPNFAYSRPLPPPRTGVVQTLGADWLVASGHKMCGPTGIGFLWGKMEVLETMRPWKVRPTAVVALCTAIVGMFHVRSFGDYALGRTLPHGIKNLSIKFVRFWNGRLRVPFASSKRSNRTRHLSTCRSQNGSCQCARRYITAANGRLPDRRCCGPFMIALDNEGRNRKSPYLGSGKLRGGVGQSNHGVSNTSVDCKPRLGASDRKCHQYFSGTIRATSERKAGSSCFRLAKIQPSYTVATSTREIRTFL